MFIGLLTLYLSVLAKLSLSDANRRTPAVKAALKHPVRVVDIDHRGAEPISTRVAGETAEPVFRYNGMLRGGTWGTIKNQAFLLSVKVHNKQGHLAMSMPGLRHIPVAMPHGMVYF